MELNASPMKYGEVCSQHAFPVNGGGSVIPLQNKHCEHFLGKHGHILLLKYQSRNACKAA